MTTYEESFEDAIPAAVHARIAEALAPLPPPAARLMHMRGHLQARIADSVERQRGLGTRRRDDAQWQDIANGVRARVLHDNGSSRSVILEFEPGASVPAHRHNTHEECLVLSGSLDAGEQHVSRHDYHIAPAGSLHTGLSSTQGGVAFVRGTSVGSRFAMLREYFAGWLPGSDEQPYTIAADSGEWREVGAGVRAKTLLRAGSMASLLLRLEAGARMPAGTGAGDRECLVVSGEALLGDVLLREGEYQMSPAGRPQGEVYSDTGALLFVHADAAYA